MRVCHLVSGDLWAGAEAVVFQLLRGLRRSDDVEPSAVLLNRGRLADELERCGVPVRVVEEGGRSFPGLALAVRGRVREFRPHVIHSHRYKENLLALVAGGGRTRLVSTLHGLPEQPRARAGAGHRLVRGLDRAIRARCFARTVAVSDDIRRRLLSERSIPAERLAMIHNGIEIPAAIDDRGERSPVVVGSCGRLFPVKDYPLMVEIARELSSGPARIRWELAGDGPGMAQLRSLVRRHGLEASFALRGHLGEMTDFFRGLDIYLSTSVHEGIPMSVLEAMSHGLPVVAPRVGGFPEIVGDGESGFLVDGRGPGAFGERIAFLAANTAMRARMGMAARQKVEREFSVGRMVERYRDLYRAVLGSAEPAPP